MKSYMLNRFLNCVILYFIQVRFYQIKVTVLYCTWYKLYMLYSKQILIFFSEIQNNTVEDIKKSSSEDIINRDTGKKELPMITLFCIRLQYSALIFYHRQKETTEWYNVVLVSGSEKHHVTDASSGIKTKEKFLKIDDQG